MAGIDKLRNKIEHYLVSTQQDGAGIAMGRRSTDGSPYKSRIVEFTDMIMQDITTQQQELLDRVMGEVIGEDQKAVRDAPEIEKLLHNSKRRIDHRNQLREQQRSAIKKIQGELK